MKIATHATKLNNYLHNILNGPIRMIIISNGRKIQINIIILVVVLNKRNLKRRISMQRMKCQTVLFLLLAHLTHSEISISRRRISEGEELRFSGKDNILKHQKYVLFKHSLFTEEEQFKFLSLEEKPHSRATAYRDESLLEEV